jgi:UPF0755 protein
LKRALVVLAVLGMVGTGALGYVYVHRPSPGPAIDVYVPAGATTARIADELRSDGVISSLQGFRVVARIRGLDGSLRAGRYRLRKGMGVLAALDVMRSGPTDKTFAVTIPEGYTVRQIAAKVASRTPIGAEAFLRAARPEVVRPADLPAGTGTLEGFLFPETYVIGEWEPASIVVPRMVSEFERRASALDWSFAFGRGLTRYQALTLASLVEREAKVPEDRAKIAAVIYNRLKKGMNLQIDATVLYDLPAHKVPTKKDLERPTPYNTYLHPGLPPTPIANPGIESLRAALAPAQIDALYYVVVDKSGRHGFANTFEEFQRLLRTRRPA